MLFLYCESRQPPFQGRRPNRCAAGQKDISGSERVHLFSQDGRLWEAWIAHKGTQSHGDIRCERLTLPLTVVLSQHCWWCRSPSLLTWLKGDETEAENFGLKRYCFSPPGRCPTFLWVWAELDPLGSLLMAEISFRELTLWPWLLLLNLVTFPK